MQKKQLFAQLIKATKLAEGEVEGIVATEGVDRQGEKIDIKGLDIKNFMAAGGPVLFGHDYQSLPIGKTLTLRKSLGKLIARFKLATDISMLARQVYDLMLGGYLSGLSVGFIGSEFDEDNATWVKSEMLEFSVVPVPANSEAMVTAKSKGLKTDKLEDFSIEEPDESEEPVKEQDFNIETLSSQISALEGQVSALSDIVSGLDTGKKGNKGKRKLVLVTAKKNAQIVDKQIELVISALKKHLSTDNT